MGEVLLKRFDGSKNYLSNCAIGHLLICWQRIWMPLCLKNLSDAKVHNNQLWLCTLFIPVHGRLGKRISVSSRLDRAMW